MPPGIAPCCPPAAGSIIPILDFEQSPLGSDFAEFLGRNDQTEIDLSDLGDFNDHPQMPLETHHSDKDPFGLSFPDSSFASSSATAFDSASQAPDGDFPRHSPSHEPPNWATGTSGPGTNSTAARLAEERQQLLFSHGLTSEEVESSLAWLPLLGEGPKQTEHHPGTDPADSSHPERSSSHSVGSRRTTITIDNMASETMMEVMQILINAKAKVRFETE